MGTHDNGPAVIAGTSLQLKQWIDSHPASLGSAVTQKFGANLPYLFKACQAV